MYNNTYYYVGLHHARHKFTFYVCCELRKCICSLRVGKKQV